MVISRGWMILILGLIVMAPEVRADQQGAAQKPRADKKSAELIKEGKVRVVRGLRGASAQLTDHSNKDWFLAGSLAKELRRLSGHRIKVWATAGKKKLNMPVLQVTRYEILDSGGRKPLVGILQQSDTKELFLQQDQGTIKITGRSSFIKRLLKRIGCRVWIVGIMEGKALKAYKYGWLSCDTKKKLELKKETKK